MKIWSALFVSSLVFAQSAEEIADAVGNFSQVFTEPKPANKAIGKRFELAIMTIINVNPPKAGIMSKEYKAVRTDTKKLCSWISSNCNKLIIKMMDELGLNAQLGVGRKVLDILESWRDDAFFASDKGRLPKDDEELKLYLSSIYNKHN